MSKNKIIFLVIFALLIVGLNVVLQSWAHLLKAEEVTYLKDEVVWRLTFDHQDRLWATVSRKLYESCSLIELRVYENGEISHVYTDIENGCRFAVGEFIVDSTGRVWFWVQQYEKYVAVNDGENWLEIPLDFMNDEPNIRTIAVDVQGKLWIGTANDGLYIVDGNEWKNYTVNNSGLVGNVVTGIAFDNQDRAWIGSYNYGGAGGVNIFDGENWQVFTPENSPLLDKVLFPSIAFDKQNRAWIGTDQEIMVFDGRDWVSYPTNKLDLNSVDTWRSGNIVSMVFDGQGRVWANNTRVFDGKTWKYYFDPYHSGVNDTAVDNDGSIWVATNNGVVVIRPGSPQPVSYGIGMVALGIASGALVYFTLLLLVTWISVAFNVWRSMGYGLLGLPVYFIFLMMNSSIYMDHYDVSFGSNNIFVLNPAIFGTIGGIIGGIVEIYFERHGTSNAKRWGLIGFVIGTVVSFCVLIVPGFFMQ